MTLLLIASVASAYTLSGYAWPPERLPIEVHWTGQVEGLSHEELQHAVDGVVHHLLQARGGARGEGMGHGARVGVGDFVESGAWAGAASE